MSATNTLPGGKAATDTGDLVQPLPKEGFFRSRPWRRFVRSRFGVIGVVTITLVLFMVVAAPLISRYSPRSADAYNMYQSPSAKHWLGTDELGRDIWSRVIYGGRASLFVGVAAVLIQTGIGTLLGAISGYFGGKVDMFVQRLVDVMMVFPELMFLLILVSLMGPGLINLFLAIGLLHWPGMCRLVRGQILSLRETDFILASRSVGASHWRIIFRHIMPNLIGIVVVSMVTSIGGAILMEAGMSYLGLGVQPPTPSWGNMVGVASNLINMQQRPWTWMPPALAMIITVLSFNFIGDTLRDVFDPYGTR